MRFLGREKAAVDTEFNPANELGVETAAKIDGVLAGRIQELTNQPYFNGGLLAADHMVVFGTTGFSQWSHQQEIKSAIEERIRRLPEGGDLSVKQMPEWVLGLYAPAFSAAAVLYGRKPTEEEQKIIKHPLLKAVDDRIEGANKTAYNKNNQPFRWSYAAKQLAELRILSGEEDFQEALSMGGGYMVWTAEELQQQFATSIRVYTRNIAGKDGSSSPAAVTGYLAALRIIEAQSVEIVEGEGLRIVEGELKTPSASTEEKELGKVAVTSEF